jgi:hypothetical protein
VLLPHGAPQAAGASPAAGAAAPSPIMPPSALQWAATCQSLQKGSAAAAKEAQGINAADRLNRSQRGAVAVALSHRLSLIQVHALPVKPALHLPMLAGSRAYPLYACDASTH